MSDVDESMAVFFVGTAGSGKSTLVAAFKRWMELEGYRAIGVNLDPGVEVLSFEADVDVREWVTLGQVMEEFNLGPNGAQVAAADMMAMMVMDISEAIDSLEADYVLYDAPGQLELFAFRSSSKRLIQVLGGSRPALAYLFDPMLVRTANGFVTSLLLASTVQFRFDVPMVNVLSKVDLLSEEEREPIFAWMEDKWRLYNDVTEGEMTSEATLAIEALQAIEALGAYKGLVPASSATGEGLDDIYSNIQLVYAGGEDLEQR